MAESSKKVLIVEDDQQISRVYEIQLKKEGISTIVARDGEEAIKLLMKEKPDLVVLDLMLPKKDGFDVLREVRGNPDLSKIPMIIISNLGQADDKTRALELGATEYLVKIDQSILEIIKKIKNYLNIEVKVNHKSLVVLLLSVIIKKGLL